MSYKIELKRAGREIWMRSLELSSAAVASGTIQQGEWLTFSASEANKVEKVGAVISGTALGVAFVNWTPTLRPDISDTEINTDEDYSPGSTMTTVIYPQYVMTTTGYKADAYSVGQELTVKNALLQAAVAGETIFAVVEVAPTGAGEPMQVHVIR